MPTNLTESRARGWDELDVVLVTGDAYVDHPFFGAALIGRGLEAQGFRVGILPQPDWKKLVDFRALGAPRLFFGITAGSLDSGLSWYTVQRKKRRSDGCTPGGAAGARPRQATIVYAGKVREAYPGVPIVLGGLEASLRRLAYYDYWTDAVRRPVLFDAKADLLVYGMGERAVLAAAERARAGERGWWRSAIPGTACILPEAPAEGLALPSYAEVARDPKKYAASYASYYRAVLGDDPRPLVQPVENRFLVLSPPTAPLAPEELDSLHELPFTRLPHPRYGRQPIPTLETVQTSIVSHRGCSGGCHFCAVGWHQGRHVVSRSRASILREVRQLASRPFFRGTVRDLGGATANLWGARCGRTPRPGQAPCLRSSCLVPARCPQLELDQREYLRLLGEAARVPGVKHLFVSSGLRYDLLAERDGQELLAGLLARHLSGWLKIAPEHFSDAVLSRMRKPPAARYEAFLEIFRRASKNAPTRCRLVHYLIAGHPGATLAEEEEAAAWAAKHGLQELSVQEYYPAPLTPSQVMYHAGLDPGDGKPVAVCRTLAEKAAAKRAWQRAARSDRNYDEAG